MVQLVARLATDLWDLGSNPWRATSEGRFIFHSAHLSYLVHKDGRGTATFHDLKIETMIVCKVTKLHKATNVLHEMNAKRHYIYIYI